MISPIQKSASAPRPRARPRRTKGHAAGTLVALAALGGCPMPGGMPQSSPGPAPRTLDAAVPDAVPVPGDDSTTDARVALGRMLFWDPLLSGETDVACATCHHPAFDYADGRPRSLGTGATGLGPGRTPDAADVAEGLRNAPTVLDTAFNGWTDPGAPVDAENAPMFWDSRERSLERQALGPLTSAIEMRGPHLSAEDVLSEIPGRIAGIEAYRSMFAAAFGDEEIAIEQITSAIATFERTLVIRDTSYDRFMAGDGGALDASQQRGLAVFRGAGCTACHGGPMFSDYALHRLGLIETDPTTGAGRDSFRTPSLRHVARTGPYMHDGSLPSLEAVVAFYRNVDRRLDPGLRGLRPIDPAQATDLVHFLESLSDGAFDRSVPESVPSGLPPGGL